MVELRGVGAGEVVDALLGGLAFTFGGGLGGDEFGLQPGGEGVGVAAGLFGGCSVGFGAVAGLLGVGGAGGGGGELVSGAGELGSGGCVLGFGGRELRGELLGLGACGVAVGLGLVGALRGLGDFGGELTGPVDCGVQPHCEVGDLALGLVSFLGELL